MWLCLQELLTKCQSYIDQTGARHDNVIQSGNLWCDITDHFPNAVLVSNNKKTSKRNDRPHLTLFSTLCNKICRISLKRKK